MIENRAAHISGSLTILEAKRHRLNFSDVEKAKAEAEAKAAQLSRGDVDAMQFRPRKDKRGVGLNSDVLPFGRLWYGGRTQ